MKMHGLVMTSMAMVGLVMGASCDTSAAIYTLTDKSVSSQLNIGGIGATNGNGNVLANGLYYLDHNNTPTGNASHVIDYAQQTFYYRTSTMSQEKDINALSYTQNYFGNANANPGNDRLKVTYTSPTSSPEGDFTISVDYRLDSGSSSTYKAQLKQSVTITNQSATETLYMSFFSYHHVGLNGMYANQVPGYLPGDPYAHSGPGMVEWAQMQTVDGFTTAYQTETLYGAALSQAKILVSGTYSPQKVELNTNGALKADLDDSAETNLLYWNLLPNQTFSSISGNYLEIGFQWYVQLNPGDTLLLSDITQVIPEPTSLSLLALGGLVLASRRRA